MASETTSQTTEPVKKMDEEEHQMANEEASSDALVEVMRRVEALETGIGEILARLGANEEAPEAEEGPVEEPGGHDDEKEQMDYDEDKTEQMDDDCDDEKVEEAEPMVPVSAIKQAVAEALKEQSAANKITQARAPKHVETPVPSNPKRIEQAQDEALGEAAQRLVAADPTAIRDLTRALI